MKRFLNQAEAERCEMAKEPVCKCRCGGEKHGAGRLGKGGDFSLLPITDPHYRPSMTRAQTVRFLKDAAVRFVFPRVWNREIFIKQFGWEMWVEQDKREQNAYFEALGIFADAIKEVKKR